jgi:hypothetical protein
VCAEPSVVSYATPQSHLREGGDGGGDAVHHTHSSPVCVRVCGEGGECVRVCVCGWGGGAEEIVEYLCAW